MWVPSGNPETFRKSGNLLEFEYLLEIRQPFGKLTPIRIVGYLLECGLATGERAAAAGVRQEQQHAQSAGGRQGAGGVAGAEGGGGAAADRKLPAATGVTTCTFAPSIGYLFNLMQL